MLYIFDFDGTIVENLKIDYTNMKKELCNLYKIDNNFKPIIETIIDLDENKFNDAMKIIDKYELKSLENYKLKYDNILYYIRLLKKKYIEVALLTRNGYNLINKFIEMYNCNDIFNETNIVTREDSISNLKPNTEHLNKLLIKINYNNDKIVMIGDSWHDEELCKRAKIEFIHINNLITN